MRENKTTKQLRQTIKPTPKEETSFNLLLRALADYEQADEILKAEGSICITKSGFKTCHPAVKLRKDAFDRYIKLMKLFAREAAKEDVLKRFIG